MQSENDKDTTVQEAPETKILETPWSAPGNRGTGESSPIHVSCPVQKLPQSTHARAPGSLRDPNRRR